PQELTRRGGEGIAAIFRPESCAIYARGEADYLPIFVSGRAPPAGFEADGPLAATLHRRREPLVLGGAGRRPEPAPLGPFDRAALESLAAEVVLPVRHREELRALVCLGPKRSGDVYTPTDVTLLSALVDKVSTELLRFDDARLLREGREMARSLRRYVPGAIAEELDRGRELEEGEREVSVLFVDLRGYTAFAEARASREVFSSVNRYTEAVSRRVRAHGGAVVEFNGDGMMAVFGAPTPLPDKEQSAVSAGREIISKVQALGETDESETLSVGVGVATGSAFVGTIQAVDRLIWTALGNTTNLAARLQGLTRELDAPW
ncbi:MAG: adenylate/guanylate cyclase domain-containing protein, partial [Candidatus Rokubacteria bacterium]|nr:adenylate/guanylate cyclase domain-containing protein [Candidatus Rokubacteria bacterium]